MGTHPQNPENPYGWTKLFVEKVMQDYDQAYGLRFVAAIFQRVQGDRAPPRASRPGRI